MNQTKPQLFLLHFAGGNMYSYQFLKEHISTTIDFIPIELPGRGRRMREPLVNDMAKAAEDQFARLRSLRNGAPYVIFGHSMGALIGLRVCELMEKEGDAPAALVVSGNAGPGAEDNKIRSTLPDPEFKEELLSLGGIQEEILAENDLFAFFSPVLRADFALVESDGDEAEKIQIESRLIALMGTTEDYSENIDNWERFTGGSFSKHLLYGDHFFIHDHPTRLARILEGCYR